MDEKEKPKNLNPEKINVEAKIGLVRQQCAQMGANDYELPELDRILESWRNKEISDQEALAKAQQILDSKQDYH